MTGVMSLWTKPYLKRNAGYSENFLMLWAYSVALARCIFPKLILYTDKPGQRLLKDFPYDEFRLDLEWDFTPHEHVWAAGKLVAFAEMDQPFVHFDGDVLLFKNQHAFGADVFAQSDESYTVPETGVAEPVANYILRDLYSYSGVQRCPWLPGHVRYSLLQRQHWPYNNGIFGGSDLDFIHEYATEALQVLAHPLNQGVMADNHGTLTSCFLEQYLLGSLARLKEKHISVLFPGTAVGNERFMRETGYTHLLGLTKHDPDLMRQVHTRMETDFYYLYEVVKAMRLPLETVRTGTSSRYYSR
jgi:hypothetical protein